MPDPIAARARRSRVIGCRPNATCNAAAAINANASNTSEKVSGKSNVGNMRSLIAESAPIWMRNGGKDVPCCGWYNRSKTIIGPRGPLSVSFRTSSRARASLGIGTSSELTEVDLIRLLPSRLICHE